MLLHNVLSYDKVPYQKKIWVMALVKGFDLYVKRKSLLKGQVFYISCRHILKRMK